MQQVLFGKMNEKLLLYHVSVHLVPYEHYEAHMNAKVASLLV